MPIRRRKRTSVNAIATVGASMPSFISPQIAQLVAEPPEDNGWVHEIMYHGYRMMCRRDKAHVQLISRDGQTCTATSPAVARAAAKLSVTTAWLDGVACVMGARADSTAARQSNLISNGREHLLYFVFDLLYLDGIDLRAAAFIARKRLLQQVLQTSSMTIRYSPHFDTPGRQFLKNICQVGLDGIVSKRSDSTYHPGLSHIWLKTRCTRQ